MLLRRDERKKNLQKEKLQGQFVEKTRNNWTRVFRKVDKEWVCEERDRGHVVCSSGACTKYVLCWFSLNIVIQKFLIFTCAKVYWLNYCGRKVVAVKFAVKSLAKQWLVMALQNIVNSFVFTLSSFKYLNSVAIILL